MRFRLRLAESGATNGGLRRSAEGTRSAPDDVEIIGIVVNEKGAQRAIETHAVHTLGFPYSISETFLRKNQNQSAEDALEELEKIQKKADDGALDVVVYVSMAFGNPYGDLWNVEEVIEGDLANGSRA